MPDHKQTLQATARPGRNIVSSLRQPPHPAVLVAICLLGFLIILRLGVAPAGIGLEPSWQEVLGWALLHGWQWGRDIVFTYGPTGFLLPYAASVPDLLGWFVAGQVLLTAAYFVAIGLLLRKIRLLYAVLFVLGCMVWIPVLSADVPWALTLLFATMFLSGASGPLSERVFHATAVPFALVFSLIALGKFSMLPLWLLCVLTLVIANLAAQQRMRALLVACAFPASVLLVWLACGQKLANIPDFVQTSLPLSAGYSHAMGMSTSGWIELGAGLWLAAFAVVCAHAAWVGRRNITAVTTVALTAATAALFGLAFLTRGDHWPWFYSGMGLLPLALLGNGTLRMARPASGTLLAMMVVSIVYGMVNFGPATIVRENASRVIHNTWALSHPGAFHAKRQRQWQQARQKHELRTLRARVGNARIDLLSWDQATLLVNGLHYAPRPVFQSYTVYTPFLQRLNEAYFLGPKAPPYVALKLGAIDGRMLMSEDALSLAALLRRYRPVLRDGAFELLQRDDSISAPSPVQQDVAGHRFHFGQTVPVHTGKAPTLAFIDIRLSPLGKLYTLLLREPEIDITLRLGNGSIAKYRLLRETAGTGFVLSPLIQSTKDWTRLYAADTLPKVKSLRIDTRAPWARNLFDPNCTVALQTLPILRSRADRSGDSATATP